MLICNLAARGDVGLLRMGVPNVFSQDDLVRTGDTKKVTTGRIVGGKASGSR